MKSTLEQLTPKEREALVHFYGTATYDALKHLCRLEIEGLGKDALGSPSHEQTRYFAGQANMAAKLTKVIKSLYEESKKNEELKKKEG